MKAHKFFGLVLILVLPVILLGQAIDIDSTTARDFTRLPVSDDTYRTNQAVNITALIEPGLEKTAGVTAQTSETPCMLCDFETGVNTNGPIGGGTGYFKCRESYDPSPVASPGAVGTDYCIRDTSSPDYTDNTFYIDNPASRTLIEEAYGANRFRIWLKLPVGFSQAADNNLHFGTYTRDPEIPSNVQGSHYYHYFNLQGSPYWTKLIANSHPNKRVGSKDDIVDNPTLPAGWNYYDGFTRFYFEILSNNGMTEVYDWYLDEAEFYYEPEPENTVSINSIACSYFGDGHFQLNWRGEYRAWNNAHYEVRYSTSPITNANYASATIAPGCSDLVKVPGAYVWVKADFTIPITSGTAYFAIKDISSDNPYVTRIDYSLSVAESLALHGTPANQAIHLTWTVNASLPPTSTWQISYDGPTGDQPSPITGIISPTRAYTLTGLTNYTWYTVTLNAMSDSTPFLTDTVRVMPSDIFVYLPVVLNVSSR